MSLQHPETIIFNYQLVHKQCIAQIVNLPAGLKFGSGVVMEKSKIYKIPY